MQAQEQVFFEEKIILFPVRKIQEYFINMQNNFPWAASLILSKQFKWRFYFKSANQKIDLPMVTIFDFK